MEQIFENMDELKKQLFDAIDTICKDYEKKHEPEFKVGDWVIGKGGFYPEKPERIKMIEGAQYYPEEPHGRLKYGIDHLWNVLHYVRHATKEEYEKYIEKKKRPETRDEFKEFLNTYTEKRLIPFEDLNKDEFLDEYEIE